MRAAVWALAIAGLIFLASSRSTVVSTGVTKIDDKFAHFAVYGLLKSVWGIRLSQEEEYYGADLSIHKIGATSQD